MLAAIWAQIKPLPTTWKGAVEVFWNRLGAFALVYELLALRTAQTIVHD